MKLCHTSVFNQTFKPLVYDIYVAGDEDQVSVATL